jgi:hypothetical protein
MSAGSERIKAAAAVTAATEKKIAAVCGMFGDSRPIDSRGVYVDKHRMVNDLAAARAAFESALQAVQSCPWPSAADYKDGDSP